MNHCFEPKVKSDNWLCKVSDSDCELPSDVEESANVALNSLILVNQKAGMTEHSKILRVVPTIATINEKVMLDYFERAQP